VTLAVTGKRQELSRVSQGILQKPVWLIVYVRWREFNYRLWSIQQTLATFLCHCEEWYRTVREQHQLQASENKVLKRVLTQKIRNNTKTCLVQLIEWVTESHLHWHFDRIFNVYTVATITMWIGLWVTLQQQFPWISWLCGCYGYDSASFVSNVKSMV
jgi:hypothetical protein